MKANKPRVNILLSTYNGSEYLSQLIDSVLNQKLVDVRIEIRDDGSIDDTIDIIKSYNDSRIVLYSGSENLGPAISYLVLAAECSDADYYAFCDQDDVWYETKLIESICMIEDGDRKDEPTLYMSTYDVTDESLKKLFTYDMSFSRPLRLEETIVYRSPSACTMVFNHAFREIMSNRIPVHARMHDFWTLMIAEALNARIVTDDRPQLMYRQHKGNSVGIVPSVSTRAKRLISSVRKRPNERLKQAIEFKEIYGTLMSEKAEGTLDSLVSYKDDLKSRVKLLFDKSYTTGDPYIDLLFKLSIASGVF